jgi:WD40 repeat protein
MKARIFPFALLLIAAASPAWLHAQTDPAIIWSHQERDALTHRAAIAYSPDGKLVASGRADDMDVKLWNATTGALVRTLHGRNNNANVIAFSPDSRYLATGTGESGQVLSLNLWRVADGALLVGRIGAFTNGTISLDFSPNGELLVAAGFYKKSYKIYHVPDMQLIAEVGNFDPQLGYNVVTNAVAFSPDGQLIAVGDNRGVHLRRASDGALVHTLNTNAPRGMNTNAVAFSPDGQFVAAGVDVIDGTDGTCVDCAVKMFRVADGAHVNTYSNGNHMIFPHVAFSPNGSIIAAAYADDQSDGGSVQFWNVSTGESLRRDVRSLWPWDFAYSPFGKGYAFFGADGLIAKARAPLIGQ